ncbi:MAG: hypothetical protein KKE30_18070 [Gammaproteobacteria bacterium]|nr:hypothetical protein [Gammaproteobacteria bacterium]MBU1554797.1 hypothetical protein [Gammaproteobacteria bacterium]MBU2069365.1 hypothetical protein [Gammaproteobacteria bacterium]MBU2184423.1 hypothetical protein [Gammaproteobacteria bacterium]MBU2203076.1 hypothetical protein [Gammaproteobacteria bacterium]
MDKLSIFANIGRSIAALCIALFIVFWFPSPAFDACFPDNSSYVCGQWPNLFAGLVFVLVGYYLGPKSKYHYIPGLLIFGFLGSAEHIRFGGQLLEILAEAPFQSFYYGGLVSLLVIVAIKYVNNRWVQSVPNKLINKDK